MTAALEYAEGGGQIPDELLLGRYIGKYGVKAILGRETLTLGEIRKMNLAEDIVGAYYSRAEYRDRNGQANWSEWAGKYPDWNRLLNNAEQVAHGE